MQKLSFSPDIQLLIGVVVVVIAVALERVSLTTVYADVVFFLKRRCHHHDLTPLTSTKKIEAE